MAAPYWEYLHWAVYAMAGIGAWRYLPLGFVRLVAALTRDEQRHRRCMEVLRLARRDASRIPPYVIEHKTRRQPRPGSQADQAL
jgi:hypothetical protein